jgi:ATP-dependent RNA helicase DDX47/RRP3
VFLLTQGAAGHKVIIFTTTCNQSMKLALLLRNLNFKAVNINGQLSQTQRLNALNKFKSNERNILIATDVASRGLDIPEVDLVINFDVPQHSKDYVHRVGRTARAGKTGRAVTVVTQYDVETFQKIEQLIGKKLEEYPGVDSKAALVLHDSVVEAQRLAALELKSREGARGSRQAGGEDGDGAEDDQEATAGEIGMFKSKNPKRNNFSHKKGFSTNKSFARKRPRKN